MPLATFYATKTPSNKEILSDCVYILVTVQHPHLTSPIEGEGLGEGGTDTYFETPVNPVKNIIMKMCAFITLGCKVLFDCPDTIKNKIVSVRIEEITLSIVMGTLL